MWKGLESGADPGFWKGGWGVGMGSEWGTARPK